MWPTERPAERSSEGLVGSSVGKSAGRPLERTSETLVNRPIEGHVGKPAGRPTEPIHRYGILKWTDSKEMFRTYGV
jgi:hypothetical protein